jgi:hypothetical protein
MDLCFGGKRVVCFVLYFSCLSEPGKKFKPGNAVRFDRVCVAPPGDHIVKTHLSADRCTGAQVHSSRSHLVHFLLGISATLICGGCKYPGFFFPTGTKHKRYEQATWFFS